MHKKITRFARAGKCGALAAKGLEAACSSAEHMPAKARYPKPAETLCKSCRRENIIFFREYQYQIEVGLLRESN
jgi:hypothetical protein